ncbi:MAG: Methylthioribulose-phosphate dehydratase [Pseudomonadota bacterium]
MNLTEHQAREEICRVGRSLFERGYVHATAGNISMRLDDGFLITPTDACLGFLQAESLAKLDLQGQQISGDKASKTLALHRQIYSAACEPHPQHALRGTQLASAWPRIAAAHHALLCHESGPCAAAALPPPRQP